MYNYIHRSHVLFKKSDFTKEEIDRKNELAMFVIIHNGKICKFCGKSDLELNKECERA